VTAQLKGACLRREHGGCAEVKATEKSMGIYCRFPNLAGWAGLGTGWKHLYQVTALDRLHVRTMVSPRCLSLWSLCLIADILPCAPE